MGIGHVDIGTGKINGDQCIFGCAVFVLLHYDSITFKEIMIGL